jgi:D-glycero-beta-D-manno-heptose 1-phosphate adenylyltransferase
MGRVLTETELVDAVAADRAAGRTLSFANGCFDLLHVGHVRYLQGAAAEADRLIVAVNSDASERLLKGPNRPVLPERDRAELVSALRGVSYVVIFNDPDVKRLLLLLKPDVHCKGTDYTVETVPERGVVQSYAWSSTVLRRPHGYRGRPQEPQHTRPDRTHRRPPDAGCG